MQLRSGHTPALFAALAAAAAGCNLALGLQGYDFGTSGTGTTGSGGSDTGGSGTGGGGGTGATGATGGTSSGGAGGELETAPVALWAVTFTDMGDTLDHTANAVAVNASDHVFVTGRSSDAVTAAFQCSPGATSGAGTGYIVELDSSGACSWLYFFGQNAEGTAVAVDDNDNVILAGNFSDTLDLSLGAPMQASGQDAFVVQFGAAPTRKAVWARWITEDSVTANQAITGVGTNGTRVVIAGTSGVDDAGTITIVSGVGAQLSDGMDGEDGFVARFQQNGDYADSIAIHSTSDNKNPQSAQSLTMSPSGTFAVAGYTAGDTVVDSNDTLPSGAGLYWARWNDAEDALSDGLLIATPSTVHGAVALDSTNILTFAGEFQDAVQLTGSKLTNHGDPDIFLARFEASPYAPLQLGSDGQGEGPHLHGLAAYPHDAKAMDKERRTVLAGDFHGKLGFIGHGDPACDSGNQQAVDGFVAKVRADLTPQWIKQIGDDVDPATADAVTIDHYGKTIVVGRFNGDVDLGNNWVIHAKEHPSAFIVKLAD